MTWVLLNYSRISIDQVNGEQRRCGAKADNGRQGVAGKVRLLRLLRRQCRKQLRAGSGVIC
ncbi:MAG TPA: hypothetical protein DD979_10025 [Gammaproteobacteria bacterium]|nr:hypothetical protein [Gammaproteobacteria bacterium]